MTISELCCRQLVRTVAFVYLASVASQSVDAQNRPVADQIKIREIYVPADNPGIWPAGDWTPVTPKQLKDLIDKIPQRDSRQQAGWIRQANYSATFRDGALRSGQFELLLENDRTKDSKAIQYAPWENISLAVKSLQGDEVSSGQSTSSSVRLGVDPQGRSVLAIPRGISTIKGAWSLAGRPLSTGYQFALRLPQATVSTIRINLPVGFGLSLPGQQPFRMTTEQPDGSRDFEIMLGSSRELICLIVPDSTLSVPASHQGWYARTETSFVVSPERIQFQQEFIFESLGSTDSEIRIPLPANVEIRSIEWAGTPLENWSVSSQEAPVLRLTLSEPIVGLGRPLRILGILKEGPGGFIEAPRMIPQNTVSLSERVRLSVSRPLELQRSQIWN